MGERSVAPSGFSRASIVISKPPVAVQLPQPDVSDNRDAPQDGHACVWRIAALGVTVERQEEQRVGVAGMGGNRKAKARWEAVLDAAPGRAAVVAAIHAAVVFAGRGGRSSPARASGCARTGRTRDNAVPRAENRSACQ